MRIVGFIEREQRDVIEKILHHCGLWKEPKPRPPPVEPEAGSFEDQPLDYGFFEREIS
jgi:hypothetical protein